MVLHSTFLLVGEDAKCAVCDEIGDLTKQLFCCNCWRHYHGKCLQPEVDALPSTRMAWHCPICKICNECGYVLPSICLRFSWVDLHNLVRFLWQANDDSAI
jgi:hypothetical protein